MNTSDLQDLLLWTKQNLLVVYIAIAFSFGFLICLKLQSLFKGRALSKNRQKGQKGEQAAETWLLKNGHEVLKTQTTQKASFEVFGTEHPFQVRPDFITLHREQLWLIEVKTGQAAKLDNITTRRQLLEYQALYPEHQVGLFDADTQQLHPIEFPFLKTQALPAKPSSFKWRYLLWAVYFFVMLYLIQSYLNKLPY